MIHNMITLPYSVHMTSDSRVISYVHAQMDHDASIASLTEHLIINLADPSCQVRRTQPRATSRSSRR